MSLTEYKRKRNFSRTPEPAGKVAAKSGKRHFVVQKHDASRLHYDFRLELDGTLKSWAVPKGPSLDPTVKSLAVHVEDHPLDYADFEGVIPEGEYGGGTVMVWDRGTWEPEENIDPTRGVREGKLKFRLDGEKLHGSWALVRMGGGAGEDGKNWLLIKHNDKYAKPVAKFDVTKKKSRSVLTGRDLPTIASDADRVWQSGGAAANAKAVVKAPKKTVSAALSGAATNRAAKKGSTKKAAVKSRATKARAKKIAKRNRRPARAKRAEAASGFQAAVGDARQ